MAMSALFPYLSSIQKSIRSSFLKFFSKSHCGFLESASKDRNEKIIHKVYDDSFYEEINKNSIFEILVSPKNIMLAKNFCFE